MKRRHVPNPLFSLVEIYEKLRKITQPSTCPLPFILKHRLWSGNKLSYLRKSRGWEKGREDGRGGGGKNSQREINFPSPLPFPSSPLYFLPQKLIDFNYIDLRSKVESSVSDPGRYSTDPDPSDKKNVGIRIMVKYNNIAVYTHMIKTGILSLSFF